MSYDTALVLVDEGTKWRGQCKVLAHWVRLDVSENQVSIPSEVEKSVSSIKSDFLAWVYSIGRYKVGQKTLVSLLKIFDNFSFWWLTAIAFKSPFYSDAIFQVFKLRALEKVYFENNCRGLVYCGRNRSLHKTLQAWCYASGHFYVNESVFKGGGGVEAFSVRGVFEKLPNWLQAFLYLLRKWLLHLRHLGTTDPDLIKKVDGKPQVTIVTYFPNIDQQKTGQGRFWSRYWENLHCYLDELPVSINWVWRCFNSEEVSFKEAVSLRDACNKTSPDKYRHFFIEEFLTPKVFIKALKLYFKVYSKGRCLGGIQSAFCFPDSKLNFYPMLEKDWKSSLFGVLAIEGALQVALFDSMAKTLPTQVWSLIGWENQSWESAFISAWRRYQQGSKVYACQHALVRALDLRMFNDPRTYQGSNLEVPPLPDNLGVVSSGGLSQLRDSGYPLSRLVRVEALRYFWLKGKYKSKIKESVNSGLTLLVLPGGASYEEARVQLRLLNEVAEADGLRSYSNIIIKSHPGLPLEDILGEIKPKFNFSVARAPLSEILMTADVMFCSNTTGVSLEAAYLGVPVIIMAPTNSLNQNPVFGMQEVRFVDNGNVLAEQLISPPRPLEIGEDYFFLDENLSSWKNLLKV